MTKKNKVPFKRKPVDNDIREMDSINALGAYMDFLESKYSNTTDPVDLRKFELFCKLISDKCLIMVFAERAFNNFWCKQVMQGNFSQDLLNRLRTRNSEHVAEQCWGASTEALMDAFKRHNYPG